MQLGLIVLMQRLINTYKPNLGWSQESGIYALGAYLEGKKISPVGHVRRLLYGIVTQPSTSLDHFKPDSADPCDCDTPSAKYVVTGP